MRKILLGLIVFLALSCSNDNENNFTDDTLYNVEFRVDNFTTEVMPMTKIGQTDDNMDTCSYLLYVFNQNQDIVFEEKIYNTRDTAYIFNLRLPKGTYDVVAIGFNAYIDSLWTSFDDWQRHHALVAKRITPNYANPYYHDYFYNKSAITINGDIYKDLKLTRITGRIELNILDIDKTSAYDFDRVEIYADSVFYGICINSGIWYSSFERIYLTKAQWLGYQNSSIVFNAMPDASYRTKSCLQIKLLQGDNVVKDFTDVIPRFYIYSNKKTIVTGKLMPEITDNGFNLSFDTDWGDSNIVNF